MNLSQPIPDKVLSTYIPKLFKAYPDVHAVQPSCFLLWKDDGNEVYFQHPDICHANMTDREPGFTDLITAVPKSDDLSIAYLRMLINGPYRALADQINLGSLKNNYFLHCTNLNRWPANLLFNFCIASRVPLEYPQFLTKWAKLTEKGFDKVLAFLLSYSTDGGAAPYRDYPNHHHIWLDPASDWARILNGEPTNLSSSYADNPQGCTPTNCVWGYSDLYEKFINLSDEAVSEYFGLPIVAYVEPPPPLPKVKLKPMYQLNVGQILNNGPQAGNMAAQQQAQNQAAMQAAHAAIQAMGHQPPQWPAPGAQEPQPAVEVLHDDEDPFPDDWDEDVDFDFDEDVEG